MPQILQFENVERVNKYVVQTTSTIFHVEPVGFGFNFETAQDNSYMSENEAACLNEQFIESNALEESKNFVEKLSAKGITVVSNRGNQNTPDAVFPNNWFSTHSPNEGHPYRLILYPMTATSRRAERSLERIHLLKAYCNITDEKKQILDLTYFEAHNKFLEGTGACVFDRVNRICYVGLSKRAHFEVAQLLCDYLNFKLIAFSTGDESDMPIFHTNVVLNVGNSFAMLCDECFTDPEELIMVETVLRESGKTVIPISLLQVRFFCGNALELRSDSENGDTRFIVAMSQNAWENLFDWQKELIESHCDEVVPIRVNTIERIGGGSVRCMIGELFTS